MSNRWALTRLGGVLLAAFIIAVPAAAGAQDAPPAVPGITVVGDGSVTAQPNTTTISLGVQVSAASPAEALTGARQRTDRVLQALRQRGVAENDLQTSGLTVQPIFGPSREPAADPAVTGYRGSANVTAQVADITRVGELLTAAVAAGADLVHGLSYGVKEDAALRRQAVVAAIADARPKAEAAAQASGLTLGPVRAVVEIPLGMPKGALQAGLGGGGGEGIALGELTVSARVQVTFDVSR